MQQNRYDKEPMTAVEAQRLAQEIAFGPIVFQVSRLMLKFGIFQLLAARREGLTQEEISKACGLSSYAVQVLLEASLTIGTVLLCEGHYQLAKAGWFLLNDKMVRVNMDFNHDVNYLGMFHLEEVLFMKDCPVCRLRYRRVGWASTTITRIALSTKHCQSFSPAIPKPYWT